MRYCGFSEFFHDAALAIVEEDGRVSFASHAERFDKKKHSSVVPPDLWKYSKRDDYLVFYEDRDLRLKSAGGDFVFDQDDKKLEITGGFPIKTPKALKASYSPDNPYEFWSHEPDESGRHHESHIANALHTRPWEGTVDTVCVSIDGYGEYISALITTPDYKVIHEQHMPKSIGMLYSIVTESIGLKPLDDEYVVMGLASYGEPKYTDWFLDLYEQWSDLNPELGHNPIRSSYSKIWQSYSKQRNELVRKIKSFDDDGDSLLCFADIAASIQEAFEIIATGLMKLARRHGSKLVYSGGCAQNVTFNSKLWDIFDNVHIAVSPSDAGSALGCAARVWARETGGDRVIWSPYIGYDMGCTINPREVVDHLLKDEYCGIASGKAEWGPRALGNRSLIADPRKDVQNTVNYVKRRQAFRPFAPAILEEFVDEYFDGPTNEYMQYTSKALHDHKSVTHVDGTARVQVVRKDCESIFRQIIEEFYDRTGCPMLLNTSLNIRGRPMVNDHHDAEVFESKYDVRVFT